MIGGSSEPRGTMAVRPLMVLVLLLGFINLCLSGLAPDTKYSATFLAQASYAANSEALDAQCTSEYSYTCQYPQYDTRTGQRCGLGRKVYSSQVEGSCVAQNKAEALCVMGTGEEGCAPLEQASGPAGPSGSIGSPDTQSGNTGNTTISNTSPPLLSPDTISTQAALSPSNDLPSGVMNPQPLQDQGQLGAQIQTGEPVSASTPNTGPLSSNPASLANDMPTPPNGNTLEPTLTQKINDEMVSTYISMQGDPGPLLTGLNNRANDINMEQYNASPDAISAEMKASPEYQELSTLTTSLDTATYPNQLPNQLNYLSANTFEQSLSSSPPGSGANITDLRDAPLTMEDLQATQKSQEGLLPQLSTQSQMGYYNWFYDSVGYPAQSYASQVGTAVSDTISKWERSIGSFFGR